MPASKGKNPLSDSDRELEENILKVLGRDPDRQDLRLKLLHLYYSAGQTEEFLREAESFREYGGEDMTAREWLPVAKMGRSLKIDSPLFRRELEGRSGWKSGGDDFDISKRFGQDPASQRQMVELSEAYEKIRQDPRFLAEFDIEQTRLGRPTPLYVPRRFNAEGVGAQICLKREDYAPAGSRLALHILGQALLAQRMNKKTLLVSSTDGRKGVITASIAARLGLNVRVFMDEDQMPRQATNVKRMNMMGAQVDGVNIGRLPRNDIREAALQHYVKRPKENFMVMGLDAGPEPYPSLAVELCSVIGREARRQVQAQFKAPPSLLVARGGENSDALGFFDPYLEDSSVRMVCVEPAPGRSDVPDDDDAYDLMQIEVTEQESQRIRAILEGLDYPSVTREHQRLKASGRVEYRLGNDRAGEDVMRDLARTEGLLTSLETAQAVAWAREAAKTMPAGSVVVVMVSERADMGRMA